MNKALTSTLLSIDGVATLLDAPGGIAAWAMDSALQSAVKAAGLPAREAADFAFTHETRLKIEETLVAAWTASNDARGAANDWLSLITTVSSLQSTIDAFEAEIETLAVWRPRELDASEDALLKHIETTELYAALDAQRGSDALSLIDSYFSADDRQKMSDATLTTGTVAMRRDPMPGAPAPWANSADAGFNKFASGQPMYAQATAAQQWQESRALAMAERQLRQQAGISEKTVQATRFSSVATRTQLQAIDAQRNVAAVKLASLRAQRDVLKLRLSSTSMAWDARAAGLLRRHNAAVARLAVYGEALLACVGNLFPGRMPEAYWAGLRELLAKRAGDVGSRLDDVAVYFNAIEALLKEDVTQSQISMHSWLVPVSVLGHEVSIDIKPAEHRSLVRAKLRGIGAVLVEPDTALLQATLTAPALGEVLDPPTIDHDAPTHELAQDEVGRIHLGVLGRRGEPGDDRVMGTNQCWNASPFGTWKLSLQQLGSATPTLPVNVLLTFHVAHRRER